MANPAASAQINAQLGQGEPASWQYAHYLLRLLHGNLCQSQTVRLSVDTLLWRALQPTLSLMIGAMIFWLTAGVLVGTVQLPVGWLCRYPGGSDGEADPDGPFSMC